VTRKNSHSHFPFYQWFASDYSLHDPLSESVIIKQKRASDPLNSYHIEFSKNPIFFDPHPVDGVLVDECNSEILVCQENKIVRTSYDPHVRMKGARSVE